jgi:predicted DNA binding CopG/RHH family protein
MMEKLDKEELDILNSFEHNEWQSVQNKDNELVKHQQYATATLEPEQRVDIYLSIPDLKALQQHAVAEGLSYQALAAHILHQYLSGTLMEKHNLG